MPPSLRWTGHPGGYWQQAELRTKLMQAEQWWWWCILIITVNLHWSSLGLHSSPFFLQKKISQTAGLDVACSTEVISLALVKPIRGMEGWVDLGDQLHTGLQTVPIQVQNYETQQFNLQHRKSNILTTAQPNHHYQFVHEATSSELVIWDTVLHLKKKNKTKQRKIKKKHSSKYWLT